MSQAPARAAVLAAGLTVLVPALGWGLVAAGAASGHTTAGHRAAGTTKVSYYEKTATFKQTTDHIEFTDLLYAGNHTSHAKKYTGTDHVECDLSTGEPICDAQFALGPDMLLVKGKAGNGTFTIPIVGGTGALQGAKGTLRNTTLKSGDSDLVLTYRLPA